MRSSPLKKISIHQGGVWCDAVVFCKPWWSSMGYSSILWHMMVCMWDTVVFCRTQWYSVEPGGIWWCLVEHRVSSGIWWCSVEDSGVCMVVFCGTMWCLVVFGGT
ncbi:hypothetical protein L208DRAFT_551913 [Tricholoma matsutake]|nr:hypothetical protein L208DRAFT_551913 [Tricholoma matsutake 945]